MPTEAPLRSSALTVVVALSATAAGTCALYFRRTQRHLNNNNNNNNAIVRNNAEPTCAHTRHQTKSTFPSSGTSLSHSSNMMEGTAPPTNATPLADKLADGGDEGGSASTLASSLGGVPLATSSALPPLLSSAAIRSVLPPLHDGPFQFSTRSRPTEMSDGRWAPGGWLGRLRRSVLCGLHVGGSFSGSPSSSTHTSKQHDGGAKNNVHGGSSSPRRPIDARCRRQFMRNPPPPEMRVPPSCGSSSSSGNEPDEEELGSIDPNTVAGCLREADGAAAGGALGSSTTSAPLPPTGSGEGGPWPRVRGLHFVVCVSRCVLHRTQAALFVVMPQAIQRAAMRMVKSLRAFSYRRSSVAPQEASLPISARLERALRPLCPTSPDCVPTVVLLRVPMGVEVSADVEALWAAMQQDSCAWEDGLVDIVVVEEAPNVEESATRPTFSDESLQWVGAGTSDRSITMAASAATVPPLPSMEELPSGDRRAGEATEEACGGRTTTRRLSEVGKGDELSFELFPAYRFYLDLFRAAALQEKDEAVKEALGSMPRRCPFSPTVSCDRCAPKSSIVLSPFSPNVPMFSSAVWSSSPVLMEREFCTRTIAAIDCPCGWDIRGCGEVPVQVTHRFRLWRQGSRSVAPLARAEEILRPLRAMWAKQTAAVLERGRDEEPASPSTSKAAAPSSPNSAGPAGASPPIVLTSPSISEVMVGNLLPSTREADAEALAFGLTQGLTRREEMRRTLFCTLATYVGYRLCAIPLPDRRVYRILPPGVPREVAAFARGFRLHHSSAEALLTQQRTLECILLRLESRHLRSKCERQTSAGGGEMDAADAGLFPRQTSEPPSGSGGLHSSGAASPSSWALSTLGRRAGQEPSSFDERYSPEWSLMHRAEESATYGGSSLSAEPGTSSRSRPSNNPNSAVPTTRWIATNTSTNNAAHASLKATMGATTTESLASNCSSGPPAVSNASVAESSVDLPRAPRGSMYGIYDAYYGHSITTPQSLLFRHRMANWHQLHRRSFHSAAPSESVHTGRLHPYSPNASITSISDLSFTASSQHQCLAGYYGRWGPCLSEELMQLRPLPLGLGRMDASTSAISGSPTGLMMMSDEAHFASACDPFYSNHPPRDHPCLRYVPDVMRFLLAAERGTAWTGTRFFYAFGDATASLYNASLQMKVEAEGWLHTPKYVAPPPSPQLVHAMEQPPAPPSPPPVPRYPGAHLDAGVEDGSSYLFSTTIMDEEERVEEQQRQLRLCRNEPFVPLFHHIHESFFCSVLREPFFGSPSCVLGSTPHIAQPAAGRGEGGGWGRWVASALGGGWTSSLSTATSPRRTSSSPTSAAANNVAGQVEESEVLRFGGQVRLRRDLDMKNGNFGLSPLEVWLACRYSRRVAAEVYLMDVAAAGRDPFFPTVRVVDEVVLHAVLYYHNRCLRDFVNELKNEFDLHYEPHTAWGRRCLSGNPTAPPPNEPTRPADNTPATPTTTTSEESPSPSPAAAPPMEEPAASPGSSASEGLGSFANPSPGALLLPLAELPWAVSQSGTLTMDSGIAPPPFAGTLHHDAEEDQCILQGNMPPLPPWLDLFDDQQERHLLCELEYLKEFLIEHRHTLSSAVLTPHGCNRLEGVFGTPATVFPFLLCARESVSLVRSMYDSLIDHYGLLRFESFAQFTRDAFGRDRPEILRHSPRIFRTLNPSHRGYITYDELCCWIARKLSCGGNVKPDAHLAATSMSLRLPMGLLLDRKEHWQRLECSLASLSDTEGETF